MQFSTVFIAASLPFLISASPADRRSSASSNAISITKRNGEDPGCTFDGKLGSAYINNPVGDGDGESCFGFSNGGAVTCGGPYDDDEINDIKQAVRDQATKDGQFKSSESGKWTASFQLLTTAFDDRDTSAFDKTLDSVNVDGNSGAGQMTYYWQRHGDYIQVDRDGCPGSIFKE